MAIKQCRVGLSDLIIWDRHRHPQSTSLANRNRSRHLKSSKRHMMDSQIWLFLGWRIVKNSTDVRAMNMADEELVPTENCHANLRSNNVLRNSKAISILAIVHRFLLFFLNREKRSYVDHGSQLRLNRSWCNFLAHRPPLKRKRRQVVFQAGFQPRPILDCMKSSFFFSLR